DGGSGGRVGLVVDRRVRRGDLGRGGVLPRYIGVWCLGGVLGLGRLGRDSAHHVVSARCIVHGTILAQPRQVRPAWSWPCGCSAGTLGRVGTRGFGLPDPDHQATTEPPRAVAGGPAGGVGEGGSAPGGEGGSAPGGKRGSAPGGKRGRVAKVRAGLGTGVGRIRATTRRDGADRSGLAALLDLSVINAAGDALVTVALAGSLFFSVPTGQARSKVALYLLITMVPFVLLAPVIGPLLDKVAHGRRTALAALCL